MNRILDVLLAITTKQAQLPIYLLSQSLSYYLRDF